MKLNQYIRNLIIGACLAGAAVSCKKQDLPAKPRPSPFKAVLGNNGTAIPAGGGTANIMITAGADGWWVVAPDSNWCVIAKIYGSGDYTLPVTIKPNTTGAARSIQVVVNPTFNLPPDTLIINQSN